MESLIEHTAIQARAAIRAIPNGVFEFVDFMDHDGIDLSRPIRIQVRLEIKDEQIALDFTGTDPQVKGPLNAPLAKTWTTVFYCLRCILPDDIAFNDGLTGVLDIHVPEGTLLNPHHPAPVNARSVTVNRIADVVLGALAKAVPEKVGAQACGVPTGVSFGGIDPRTKRSFVFYESYCGGLGATMHGDGADGLSTGTSNAMNIPVEAIEIDYPIRITRYELVPNSGGAGEFRGGLGLLREYEMLAEDAEHQCPRRSHGLPAAGRRRRPQRQPGGLFPGNRRRREATDPEQIFGPHPPWRAALGHHRGRRRLWRSASSRPQADPGRSCRRHDIGGPGARTTASRPMPISRREAERVTARSEQEQRPRNRAPIREGASAGKRRCGEPTQHDANRNRRPRAAGDADRAAGTAADHPGFTSWRD